jgi:hypothetical protein
VWLERTGGGLAKVEAEGDPAPGSGQPGRCRGADAYARGAVRM